MRMRKSLFLAAACVSATIATQPIAAQDPKPAKPLPVAGANNQTWLTTEVHPDRSVTFRIKAPTLAEAQLLIGDVSVGEDVYPMEKDKDGIWGKTVGPLPSEMYHYAFRLGGAKANSGFVTVPGQPPEIWELQNVPHGLVVEHRYDSKAQGRSHVLQVYLPPQYYAEPNRKFPVFYMWKPGGEGEFFPGAVPQIMFDNLIAQKKAVPMIVVMPGIDVPPSVSQGSPEARDMLDKEMVGDIIPMIDKQYRTIRERNSRAISGISQSGATALTVGMRHLDLFGNVGEFGTGFFGGLNNPAGYTSYLPYNPDNITPNLHQKLVAPTTKLKLFYMSVGEIDPRMPFQKKAADNFKKDGIDVVFKTFPGGHEYTMWRHSMIDMASQLFK